MPFDLSKLDFGQAMDMAKKLQARVAELENTLRRIELSTEVGGGMVRVRANAAGEILALEISAEAIEMKDPAVVSSLVLAGVNQALKLARERREEEQRQASMGLLPSLGGVMP